ncbi:MAG: PIN domain-containing protein [Planctomycetaceae bacterium]
MTVFLDTSGLLAVVNDRDRLHDEAERQWLEMRRDRRRLLTTSRVVIECGDGLSRLRQRPIAVALRKALLAAGDVEVVDVTRDDEARAWDLFEQRPDKEWGVTDCVSFVAMQDRGITDAFTADRHFEQAGFRPLLAAS